MLAEALFAMAAILSIAALARDGVRQSRRADALETKVIELEDRSARVWARQDRLQQMVLDDGWRDSRLLTRISWTQPPPEAKGD